MSKIPVDQRTISIKLGKFESWVDKKTKSEIMRIAETTDRNNAPDQVLLVSNMDGSMQQRIFISYQQSLDIKDLAVHQSIQDFHTRTIMSKKGKEARLYSKSLDKNEKDANR